VGFIRKMTSMSTLGLVDFRSDKERIARYTRQTRNATRAAVAQNAMGLELQREQLAQHHVHHVEAQVQQIAPQHVEPVHGTPPPQLVAAPGWYPTAAGVLQWFDGYEWTPAVRQVQPPALPR
jgi:hypothetical protein